jgi:heat shock protein HtpX
MSLTDNMQQSSGNWRAALRINNRKTYIVIALFFTLYLCLGLLVDSYIAASIYPNATVSQLLLGLFTLQIFPLATIVMLVIASISLLLTYAIHDKLMLLGTDYYEINANTARNLAETQLYNVIEETKIAAGLSYMPKVFVIEADYMNAFASGYSEKSALVAITRGLMEKLNRAELQAVMAHELSHIRHLDIKLTLTASVLANSMLIILDLFFYNAIFANSRSSENRSRNNLISIIMLLRYLLPLINILLLLYLSRTREYMADAGSVELLRDNQPLASALLKIQNDHVQNGAVYNQQYLQTPNENVRREAYIFDPAQAGITSMSSLADIFSTHPNIKDRLAAIGFKMNEAP